MNYTTLSSISSILGKINYTYQNYYFNLYVNNRRTKIYTYSFFMINELKKKRNIADAIFYKGNEYEEQ